MRCYCYSCKTEFVFSDEELLSDVLDGECPVCNCPDYSRKPIHELTPIPDYETPEQYEKRTGESLEDWAALWVKYPETNFWSRALNYSLKLLVDDDRKEEVEIPDYVVCANGPLPPPDDWRPS